MRNHPTCPRWNLYVGVGNHLVIEWLLWLVYHSQGRFQTLGGNQ